MWGLISGLCSAPWVCVSVLVPASHCSDCCRFVVGSEIGSVTPPTFVSFQDLFVYSGSLAFLCGFKDQLIIWHTGFLKNCLLDINFYTLSCLENTVCEIIVFGVYWAFLYWFNMWFIFVNVSSCAWKEFVSSVLWVWSFYICLLAWPY